MNRSDRVSFYLNGQSNHLFSGVVTDLRLHNTWAVIKVDECKNEYDREKLGKSYMVRVDQLLSRSDK